MANVTLYLSKEVAATTEDTDTYVVPNGKKVLVKEFDGSGAFDKNSAVRLIWDWGGAGEEILWTIKGDKSAPTTFERTGDGTKKMALSLDNADAGAVQLSGFVELLVED